MATIALILSIAALARNPAPANATLSSMPAEPAFVSVSGNAICYGKNYCRLCTSKCISAYGMAAQNGSWASVLGFWGGKSNPSLSAVLESWTYNRKS